MAKPEWGMKRTCQSCGVRYYDLRRSPITCPSCGAVFTPEQMPRRRSSAPAVAPVPVPIPTVLEEVEVIAPVAAVADDEVVGVEKEKIEDASDLGEDEDEMSEVKEHIDEEESPLKP